jgi:hypothetical protein
MGQMVVIGALSEPPELPAYAIIPGRWEARGRQRRAMLDFTANVEIVATDVFLYPKCLSSLIFNFYINF